MICLAGTERACRCSVAHAAPPRVRDPRPATTSNTLPLRHSPTQPQPQELVCTGAVSGALLAALVGGSATTPPAAAAAMFNELARDLLAGGWAGLCDHRAGLLLLAVGCWRVGPGCIACKPLATAALATATSAHPLSCVTHPPPRAGSPFNLTDAASTAQLMDRALAELTSKAADGAPPGVDYKAVEAAAADTVTLVNRLLEQVGLGFSC